MAAGEVAPIDAWEAGEGAPSVLCLHETGAISEVWRALASALAPRTRVIAYDRPGWGRNPAPETYLRTTIEEQAAIAARVLAERDSEPAVVCGAGLGAVAALELALHRPEIVVGAVLVEPPLLAFVREATDALADAAGLVRDAVAEGGRELALERYLGGGLGVLSAGAERLPDPARSSGAGAAATLFAELAAVPAWELPLAELGAAPRPSAVVSGADTHPLVRSASEGLAHALARSDLRELGPGLPHHHGASEVADLVIEVAEA